MKSKISITVEESVLEKVEEMLKSGRFRNKSHVIEYAVRRFLEEKNGA